MKSQFFLELFLHHLADVLVKGFNLLKPFDINIRKKLCDKSDVSGQPRCHTQEITLNSVYLCQHLIPMVD
ncbi:hypothetical protein D3C78_1887770 [compost metagenome]